MNGVKIYSIWDVETDELLKATETGVRDFYADYYNIEWFHRTIPFDDIVERLRTNNIIVTIE